MILYQIKLGYIILLGEKAELCCLFIKLYLLRLCVAGNMLFLKIFQI